MKKSISRIGVGCVLAIAAAGCTASPIEEPVEDAQEAIGQTSQALTNVSYCAMGLTPNAVANVAQDYSQESFSRSGGMIDVTCPALGADRGVTIVDFNVASANGVEYQFFVRPTWGEITNVAQCNAIELNVRFQKLAFATSTWEQIEFKSLHGTWVWNFSEPNLGHCNAPTYIVYRTNQYDHYTRETSRYRIRAEGFRTVPDEHVSIEIIGRNYGN